MAGRMDKSAQAASLMAEMKEGEAFALRLHCSEGASDKDYNIMLAREAGGSWGVVAEYGRRGTALRPVSKFGGGNWRQAAGAAAKLAAEQLSKGYEREGSPAAPAAAAAACESSDFVVAGESAMRAAAKEAGALVLTSWGGETLRFCADPSGFSAKGLDGAGVALSRPAQDGLAAMGLAGAFEALGEYSESAGRILLIDLRKVRGMDVGALDPAARFALLRELMISMGSDKPDALRLPVGGISAKDKEEALHWAGGPLWAGLRAKRPGSEQELRSGAYPSPKPKAKAAAPKRAEIETSEAFTAVLGDMSGTMSGSMEDAERLIKALSEMMKSAEPAPKPRKRKI